MDGVFDFFEDIWDGISDFATSEAGSNFIAGAATVAGQEYQRRQQEKHAEKMARMQNKWHEDRFYSDPSGVKLGHSLTDGMLASGRRKGYL